jgi:hypothetical protein
MTGLLGWIGGAANVEAAATLDAMAQAARVEPPLKIFASSSSAAVAAWQTHDTADSTLKCRFYK